MTVFRYYRIPIDKLIITPFTLWFEFEVELFVAMVSRVNPVKRDTKSEILLKRIYTF